ncbi:hypothetical protein AXF41_12165 [Clostridium haemolyticum]|nr:hypothetical protein Z958_00785 [Clostridium novyi B str. NCTC 9691]OOB76461.1 hypothetical protein AXF41_12165 [Clostridium haemolyticum]
MSGQLKRNREVPFLINKNLQILNLPIEKSKLKYMVQYMIDNDIVKNKLLELIDMDLPMKNKFIDE